MPDFITEIFRWCKSNEQWITVLRGSRGKNYTVYWSSRSGWHCTCPGFKYHEHCKHIDQAETMKCNHGWEAACGSPSNDWIMDPDGNACCPKCGGPTSLVKVAI